MSKKSLQKTIKKHGGHILSSGTLNLQHLLPKVYDLITGYRIEGQQDILDTIRKCFGHPEPTFYNQYHGMAILAKWNDEIYFEADYLWHETIFDFFNDISPKGFYFGSSEGDGACIGWFAYEGENYESAD